MKGKELAKKTAADLKKMLGEERARLAQLRFDLPSGKIKNVREIRSARKSIARIITLLHQSNR